MTSKNCLRLTFLTDSNQSVTIDVSRPLLDLTDAEIKAAMDNIIATGVYNSTKGKLAASYSAELAVVDETDLI